MELTAKYRLDPTPRDQSRWREVFDTIDANFDKVDDYLCDIATRIHVTHIVADAEQTDFKLDHPYMTDANSLSVYLNGVLQYQGLDYNETDIDAFRFHSPCSAGDRVDCVYNEFYLPEDTTSLEVQIFNALTSLKKSVYGDDYETLDEAIRASIEHAKDSIGELDSGLVEEIERRSGELESMRERVRGILDRLNTGQFHKGVSVVWFEPHMSEDGTVTWTNNGGLENPKPVRLRFDITIPKGTVAIGSKGGYGYTNPGEYGALVRDTPTLAVRNPLPHFGTVPLEFGGLGGTLEEIEALESYRGPLQYDPVQRRFLPIEGEGVLIRDAQGVRFGVVPVEYGGTGKTSVAMTTANSLSLADTRAIAVDDGSLDHLSWDELSEISRLAAKSPEEYRGWIGRSKRMRLADAFENPELYSGYDFDFGAEVTVTIVGIATERLSTGVRSGFLFAVDPLLGVYADPDMPIDADLKSMDSTLPDLRERFLEAYFELLPEDLRRNVKTVRKTDFNPSIHPEAHGDELHYYRLFPPSLSELGLYDEVADLYLDSFELADEGEGCLEYYVQPRDLFRERVDGTLPDAGDVYMLRSTALPNQNLIDARERLARDIEAYRGLTGYEPSEMELMRGLLDESEPMVMAGGLDSMDIDQRAEDIERFADSMVPEMDSMSWDEVFDMAYEMSVKSPTIVDSGDSQLKRLVGMTKRVDTESFGSFDMEFVAVDWDGDFTLTLAPSGGPLFDSKLRDTDGNAGGYNLNDVLLGNLDRFVSELPKSLAKHLVETPVTYETPDGYASWVDSSVSVPSVADVSSIPYFDGEMPEFWTRDVDSES